MGYATTSTGVGLRGGGLLEQPILWGSPGTLEVRDGAFHQEEVAATAPRRSHTISTPHAADTE